MSTGQQLRLCKEEIARIERFLPVMKRVLTMLRMEIRNYRERVEQLEQRWKALEAAWDEQRDQPLAESIYQGLSAEVVTRPESLVGVDIEAVAAVNTHSDNDPVLVSASESAASLAVLAAEHLQVSRALAVERDNLARLEDAEEEFVFLINGSEQVRLPPLYEQLSRLERALDEENGMAAAIARLLRERSETQQKPEELWQLFA
ncbi:MAG: hypothetical protein QNJ40_26705 [Xanthomonadales bacterium]|nr:hypothetical protein [Xanthomonadales bacterium]